jgi:hypothetical protein
LRWGNVSAGCLECRRKAIEGILKKLNERLCFVDSPVRHECRHTKKFLTIIRFLETYCGAISLPFYEKVSRHFAPQYPIRFYSPQEIIRFLHSRENIASEMYAIFVAFVRNGAAARAPPFTLPRAQLCADTRTLRKRASLSIECDHPNAVVFIGTNSGKYSKLKRIVTIGLALMN